MTTDDDKSFAAPNDYHVVRRTDEFDRIFNLTRRELDLNIDLTAEFGRRGSDKRLWPLQSAALHDARMQGGLFAPLGVGHGKGLISYLVLRAMGLTRGVLLVPAQLREQARKEHVFWNRHFMLPLLDTELFIVSYEDLSSAKKADVLEKIRPQVIIADEAHKLKAKDSARTKRFLRYMRASGADLVAMSGTITTRSLKDYAHLIELCLRRNAPVPSPTHAWHDLVEWAEALDSPKKNERPRNPGVLLSFCTDDELAKVTSDVFESQQYVRAGFRRRLVETPGVVASEEGALGTSLVISARKFNVPAEVQEILSQTRKTWKIGDEEIEEATRMWAIMRQLSLGFYYIWDWPNGVRDLPWLAARAAWHKEIREFLQHRSKPGMDSPFLLAAAAERGDWKSETWHAWKAERERLSPPPRKPIWFSDYALTEACRFLNEAPEPALLWYDADAFGRRLAEWSGARFVEPGDAATIERVKENPTHLVLSIASHGTGKNLQAWARQLITCPPQSGSVFEQLLGRTHRPGQTADLVRADVFCQTPELQLSWEQALRDARYLEETTGAKQKLNFATKIGWEQDESF